ncbi:MAG: hypothetical protein U0P82_02760 [Vicinamibacterales bacterium]
MAVSRVTLLFVDGLGLSDDARSPLRTVSLPTLARLTNGFALEPFSGDGVEYRLLDATLAVDGLPQSATGQTSLLTGVNAAEVLGRHQGPHPGARLQALLTEGSIHVWAARRGLSVYHANGYRREYLERIAGSRRNMRSAFAFAARAAGLELLELDDPRAHRPAYWPDPEAAGRRLAREAEVHHLTVLEYWALDWAGHREPETVPARLTELDRFVRGYLDAETDTSLMMVADHGNAEEPWHGRHTRNPVPLIVAGSTHAGPHEGRADLTTVHSLLRQMLA